MKMGRLQNTHSLETSIETGNLQRYDEQSICKSEMSNAWYAVEVLVFRQEFINGSTPASFHKNCPSLMPMAVLVG